MYLSVRDSDNLGVDRFQGVPEARIWGKLPWNIDQKIAEKITEGNGLKNTGKHKAAGAPWVHPYHCHRASALRLGGCRGETESLGRRNVLTA